MHSNARNAYPLGGASENLALAPVLATSKLLGVMENNEETRQKRLARQDRLTKATTATASTWAWLPRADSQSEGGAR
jgi:hypothetical protein